MVMRIIAFAIAAVMLAGCGGDTVSEDLPAPSPALWEITSDGGATEGWLFGTIHSLPDGVEWRTPRLDAIAAQADLIAVEIGDLDDRAAVAAIFRELAVTPGQPLLIDRVPPEHRMALRELLADGGYDAADFASMESWAAALTIARVGAMGAADNGVDRALLADFDGRPIVELEGTRRQLAIFDRLPESEQRDLLNAVIVEARKRQSDPARLMHAWRSGNIDTVSIENRRGMLADPELRAALLVNRNRNWTARIATLLEASPKPLIAVGAAHMAGTDGLPVLLSQAGYTVTRIQ